jgi:drug/metabolite transporter (DMT)-like permease
MPASLPLVLTSPSRIRGILLMLFATVCFSCMHASIRHASAEVHPFEIAFFRNLFGFFVVAPWFIRYGFDPLRTSNIRLHLARGVLNIVSMLAFFYALSITPLADVAALTFAAPIFATVLATFIYGEVASAGRWLAILLGFGGTLVILRPGYEEVGLGPILAVSAALTWAVALMVIKKLARTESSVTITSYMMVMLVPMSLVPAAFVWQWPVGTQWIWLVATGLFGTCGHLAMNQALKEAETHVVMPIDFVRLIWIALIGFAFFGELPTVFTWIGGAMICASGIYIAYGERPRRWRAGRNDNANSSP